MPIPPSPPAAARRCAACGLERAPDGVPAMRCPRCGTPAGMPTPGTVGAFSPARAGAVDPASLPSRIGPYLVSAELGRGGMGVVVRATDPRLDRTVAIKMILESPWGNDAEDIERFVREARATARLDHPAIVRVYDVGRTEDGKPYIVMDHVAGESLSARLDRERVPPRRIAEIVAPIADALHHAHTRGLVHRDVKPANILLDENGQPRLTDFGLAHDAASRQQLTLTGDILGTPAYMAPEQASGDRARQGPRCDVWALGAVLYRALCGRPPFEGDSPLVIAQKVVSEEPPAPRAIDARIHPDLETILLRCLEKDLDRRYPSAKAVGDELRRFLAGEAILARPPTRGERLRRWLRRDRGRMIAFGLAAVLAAALAATGWAIVSERIRRDALVAAETRRVEEALERTRETVIATGSGDDVLRRGRVRALLDELEETLLRIGGEHTARTVATALDASVARLRAAPTAAELDFASMCARVLAVVARHPDREQVASVVGLLERASELDQAAAATAARTLCRLGGDEARAAVLAAFDRSELGWPFWREVAPSIPDEWGSPADRLVIEGLRLRLRGDLEEARRRLDAAADLAPDRPDVLIARGAVSFELWELDAALADLDRAIDLDPKRAEAWALKSLTLLAMNRPEASRRAAAGALDLDPRLGLAHVSLAWSDLGARATDEAFLSTSRALALDPGDALAHAIRSAIHLERGDVLSAETELVAGASLSAPTPLLHAMAGWIEISRAKKDVATRDGHLEAAAGHLGLALAQAPEHSLALELLGAVRLRQGDPRRALELLDAANARDGFRDSQLVRRGRVALQLGETDRALRDFERALATTTDDEIERSATHLRGLALLARRELAAARTVLERAPTKSPETILDHAYARAEELRRGKLTVDLGAERDAAARREWPWLIPVISALETAKRDEVEPSARPSLDRLLATERAEDPELRARLLAIRALVDAAAGRRLDAIEGLDAAIVLLPEALHFRWERAGLIAWTLDDLEAALDPSDGVLEPRRLFAMTRLLRESEAPERALTTAEHGPGAADLLVRLAPGDHMAWIERGLCRSAVRDHDGAADDFAGAYAVHAHSGYALRLLVASLAAAGRAADARDRLERVLEAPASAEIAAEAARLLEQLRGR